MQQPPYGQSQPQYPNYPQQQFAQPQYGAQLGSYNQFGQPNVAPGYPQPNTYNPYGNQTYTNTAPIATGINNQQRTNPNAGFTLNAGKK
jgi:hypothetical protein